jgi:sugar (pentulose or hexulose) kinase
MKEALIHWGGKTKVFRETYVSSINLNPPFKIYRMQKERDTGLENARTFLMFPNLVEYFLSGIIHSEFSIVSTSQLFDMKSRTWSKPMLNRLGLPLDLFQPVHNAGNIIGPLTTDVVKETGKQIPVISVAGHDTASAISAIAPEGGGREFMFISSGTWSIMGFCSDTLLEDEKLCDLGISNEGTYNGLYRPTVLIVGLWILQECIRQWEAEGKHFSFDEYDERAMKAKPLQSFIRVEDFEKPGDYPKMIAEYCRKTGQKVPETPGEMVRCILESIALKYRAAYEAFKPYIKAQNAIYIVGGGVKNKLLNQFTANALGIRVITGASEATAAGSALCQLEALGEINGSDQRREVVAASFGNTVYEPEDTAAWEEAFEKYGNRT